MRYALKHENGAYLDNNGDTTHDLDCAKTYKTAAGAKRQIEQLEEWRVVAVELKEAKRLYNQLTPNKLDLMRYVLKNNDGLYLDATNLEPINDLERAVIYTLKEVAEREAPAGYKVVAVELKEVEPKKVSPPPLTDQQLVLLVLKDNCSLTKLAEATNLVGSAVYEALKELISAGFAYVEQFDVYVLSPKGSAELEKIEAIKNELSNGVWCAKCQKHFCPIQVVWSQDPYDVDVHDEKSEEKNPSRWWCVACYRERLNEI